MVYENPLQCIGNGFFLLYFIRKNVYDIAVVILKTFIKGMLV